MTECAGEALLAERTIPKSEAVEVLGREDGSGGQRAGVGDREKGSALGEVWHVSEFVLNARGEF